MAAYMAIDQAIRDLDTMDIVVRDWIDRLEDLAAGRISATLIPPQYLARALVALTQHLLEAKSGLQPIFDSTQLSYYYSMDSASYWVMDNDLFISVRV